MIAFLTNIYTNIKDYLLVGISGLLGIVTLGFLYERNKAIENAALADQAKLNENLETIDKKIQDNNDTIKTDQTTVQSLEEVKTDEANVTDIAKFFANRK